MIGNISKSKGFRGDRGDIGPQGIQGIQGIQGVKGDTPVITFEYDKRTGDLYYSSDGVLVDKEYMSSENLATKDDVNGEFSKISGDLVIDIEQPVKFFKNLLVYDKHGNPTTNIDDVHTGIFRFVEAESGKNVEQTRPCLLVQNKNVIKDKENSPIGYVVYQEILTGDGMLRYRKIEDLALCPVFTDYMIEPYDELDEFGLGIQPLSARQGFVLDQKKANKEEISAAVDELSVTISDNLSTKENIANKTKVIDDGSTDTLYPSAKAVKTYVDSYVDSNVSNINAKLLTKANRSEFEDLREEFEFKSNKVTVVDDTANNAKFPTTKAVKNYVDDKVVTITASLKNKAEQSTVTELNNNVERHLANKTTSIDENANDYKYPSTKAVKDYVESMIEACVQRILNEISPIKTTTIFLFASEWSGSDGVYSQTVTLDNVTEYSKIDLQPTAEQLHIFHEKDIAFVTENDNGIITVYCIGQKPTNDYIIQATIVEVKADE